MTTSGQSVAFPVDVGDRVPSSTDDQLGVQDSEERMIRDGNQSGGSRFPLGTGDGATDITDARLEDVSNTTTSSTVALPPMARHATSGSNKPYSAFSLGTKWFLVTLAGLAAIFSPIR
jgi:hypothetical protein